MSYHSHLYCPNASCQYYQKTTTNKTIYHSKQYLRYRCSACGKTWVAHPKTTRVSQETLRQIKSLLVEGKLTQRSIAQRLKISPTSIQRWKKLYTSQYL